MVETGFTRCTISLRNGKIIHHLTTEEEGGRSDGQRGYSWGVNEPGYRAATSGIRPLGAYHITNQREMKEVSCLIRLLTFACNAYSPQDAAVPLASLVASAEQPF